MPSSRLLPHCLCSLQNFYYVLDLVVVSGALFVELTSYFQAGPLFVVLLGWRMLRVLHGVATSVELQAVKVADANGNPLVISGVVNYRVVDATRAALDVLHLGK